MSQDRNVRRQGTTDRPSAPPQRATIRKSLLQEPGAEAIAETLDRARVDYYAADFEAARTKVERELDRIDRNRPAEPADKARAQLFLALVALAERDGEQARRLAHEAIESFRACGQPVDDVDEDDADGDVGIALQLSGRSDAAVAHLQPAAERPTAGREDVLRHLGLALAELGEPEQADRWLQSAIAIWPLDFVARDRRIEVLAGLDRSAEAAEVAREAAHIMVYSDTQTALTYAEQALELERSSASTILLGDILRICGRVEDAEQVAREAAEREPDSAEALTLLGLVQKDRGELGKAISSLRQAVSIDDTRLYAWGGLAEALFLDGRLDEAKVASDEALVLSDDWDPDYLAALHNTRSEIHYEDDEYEKAIEHAECALAAEGARRIDKAHAHAMRGLAEQALGRYEAAIVDLRKAAESERSFRHLYKHVGQAYEQLPGYEVEAIHAYQTAAQGFADADHPDPQRQADALGHVGRLQLQRDRVEDALETLREALELDPESAVVRTTLAEALLRRGELVEALELVRDVPRDAQSLPAVAVRAQIFLRLGRYDEAETDLRAIIEDDPAEGWAHAELGELARLRGRLDDAIEHLSRSVDPDEPSAWICGSLAAAHLERGDFDEAVDLAKQAVEIDPSYGWALGIEGRALIGMQKYSEAVSVLSDAVSIAPSHTWIREALGVAQLQLGDLDGAGDTYRRATKLAPDDVFLARGYVSALQWAERHDEAVEFVRALDPSTLADRTLQLALLADSYELALQYTPAVRACCDWLDELPYTDASEPGDDGRLAHADWSIRSTVGDVLMAVGEYRASTAVYEQLRRETSEGPSYARADADRGLGHAARLQLEHETSLEHFRDALAADPNDLYSHYGAGVALIRLEQPAEAAVHFERLSTGVTRRDTRPRRIWGAAWALFFTGRHEKAARYLTAALLRVPRQLQMQADLALMLTAQGNYDAADAQYDQALGSLAARDDVVLSRGFLNRAVLAFDELLDDLAAGRIGPPDTGSDERLHYRPRVSRERISERLRTELERAETAYAARGRPLVEPLLDFAAAGAHSSFGGR